MHECKSKILKPLRFFFSNVAINSPAKCAAWADEPPFPQTNIWLFLARVDNINPLNLSIAFCSFVNKSRDKNDFEI
jgi:hypothetical protein